MSNDFALRELQQKLERRLTIENGTLMTGKALHRELGFLSRSSFERARVKGVLGVKTFPILGRQGKFALTRDVAEFLAKSRYGAIQGHEEPDGSAQ